MSITFNAALNKPAYQSSGYDVSDDVSSRYPASLANDGDRRTCTVIGDGGDPAWWAVDLQEPRVVARVDITNTHELRT